MVKLLRPNVGCGLLNVNSERANPCEEGLTVRYLQPLNVTSCTNSVKSYDQAFTPSFAPSYIHPYTQVIPRSALKQRFLYCIDYFTQYENLVLGLRGGELFNSYARGYEQSAQAEALRCTKQKRPGGGAFVLLEQMPVRHIVKVRQ